VATFVILYVICSGVGAPEQADPLFPSKARLAARLGELSTRCGGRQ
jgi:hypothetical protein